MNKSELIDAIAESADLPKAAAGRALDATLEAVTKALTKGESVALVQHATAVTPRLVRQLRLLQPLSQRSNQVSPLKTL